MKILVIEDNEGDYFLVHEYLHAKFTGITITHNTMLEEANKSLAQQQFDIILLDLSLPDSNGRDSIVDIIQLANEAPVIVLTGYSDRQFAMDSLKLGVQDYLIKDDVNAFVLQKSIVYSIERNNIARNLKENEKRYRYLFDNNPDSIFIWDPNTFQVVDVNDTASNLLQFTKDIFLQMKIWDILPTEEIPYIKEVAKKLVLSNSEVEKRLIQHRTNNGELIFLEMALHRIDYKEEVAILAIGLDVSEKIKLEKKLEEEKIKKNLEIAQAVISAQEKERQEIGLELHDNVNQILAGSLMYLGLLKKEVKSTSELFVDIDKLIKSAIQEIRKLSHSLLPPSLNELELGEALDHIITIAKKSGLFEIKKDLNRFIETSISENLKLAIYRIVQEQFNNIFKHAHASNIQICLYNEGDQVILQIKDDGVGFDTANTSSGVGLINIQTRASLYHGRMEIKSAPGLGTEIKVTFQINE